MPGDVDPCYAGETVFVPDPESTAESIKAASTNKEATGSRTELVFLRPRCVDEPSTARKVLCLHAMRRVLPTIHACSCASFNPISPSRLSAPRSSHSGEGKAVAWRVWCECTNSVAA